MNSFRYARYGLIFLTWVSFFMYMRTFNKWYVYMLPILVFMSILLTYYQRKTTGFYKHLEKKDGKDD